jgi:PAS domain S-box-containing protein
MLEKLNKNGEGLKTIIDSLQAGIIIIEEETKKILDLNATARDIIGLSEEEIKGRICHNFLCPAEREIAL